MPIKFKLLLIRSCGKPALTDRSPGIVTARLRASPGNLDI